MCDLNGFCKSNHICVYVCVFKSPTIFTVRLVNGPTKYEGSVEVYYNLKWGNVCNDLRTGWDIRDGQVICNQLGFGEVEHLGFYGQRTHKVWLYSLGCLGNESRIESCDHSGWDTLVDPYGGCYDGPIGVKCTPGMYVA